MNRQDKILSFGVFIFLLGVTAGTGTLRIFVSALAGFIIVTASKRLS